MKKLVYGKYDISMKLEENYVNELIVENPAVLAEVVQELTAQTEGAEGGFILSEDEKILSIEKNLVFIKDPFSVDVNQRKLLTKLYEELEGYTKDELFFEREDFYHAYIRYMNGVCEKSGLFLTYEEEPKAEDIFKLAKLRIDCQAERLVEQVAEYLRVWAELLHQEVFVFLNLKLFLTKEELEALYQECLYRKVQIILIEAVFTEKMPEEKIYLIDKDKCIIYL